MVSQVPKATDEQATMCKHFPVSAYVKFATCPKVIFKAMSFLFLMGGMAGPKKGLDTRSSIGCVHFWQSAHHTCTVKPTGDNAAHHTIYIRISGVGVGISVYFFLIFNFYFPPMI